MTFLIRTVINFDDDNMSDETVVADFAELEAIEKGVVILGTRVTLRFEFDPPLVASEPTSDQ